MGRIYAGNYSVVNHTRVHALVCPTQKPFSGRTLLLNHMTNRLFQMLT